MATHKPLILLDGLVKQLPTGDSIEGATGGGASDVYLVNTDVAGADQSSNGLVMAAISGLTLDLASNSAYEFEAWIRVYSMGTSAGLKLSFGAPSDTVPTVMVFSTAAGNTTLTTAGLLLSTQVFQSPNIAQANITVTCLVRGMIKTGANGAGLFMINFGSSAFGTKMVLPAGASLMKIRKTL